MWCVTASSRLGPILVTKELYLKCQQGFCNLGESNKQFKLYLVAHAQVSNAALDVLGYPTWIFKWLYQAHP